MTDVVMTAIGGNELAAAVDRSPALLGYESSRSLPDGYTADFVDWPFNTEPDPKAHMQAVKEHTPRYAVAPDIEGDWPLARVLEYAAQLDLYADTVIIVPKDVPPSEIPTEYAVGYPNQPEWGTDGSWPVWKYGDRQTHLLGGPPSTQLEKAEYLNVESVDGANVAAYAEYGRVWTPSGQHERPDLSYYERIEQSLGFLHAALNPHGENHE